MADNAHSEPVNLPQPHPSMEALAAAFPDVAADDLEKFAEWLGFALEIDGEGVRTETFSESWFGPMPPALELQEYKRVQDDLPERMMASHELLVKSHVETQRESLGIDRAIVTHQTRLEWAGIIFAFALSIACVAATTWLAFEGKWQAAIPIGIVPASTSLAGLAAALRRWLRPSTAVDG